MFYIETNNLISVFSKAIVAYVFRNTIVEDYHADGYLNDNQMKELNKSMVNKVGFLLTLWLDEKYDDIDFLLAFHEITARNWDNPDVSNEERELNIAKALINQK